MTLLAAWPARRAVDATRLDRWGPLVPWRLGAFAGVVAPIAAWGPAGTIETGRVTFGDRAARGDWLRAARITIAGDAIVAATDLAGGFPLHWLDRAEGPMIATDPRALIRLDPDAAALTPAVGGRPIARPGRTPFAGMRALGPGDVARWEGVGPPAITSDAAWTRPPADSPLPDLKALLAVEVAACLDLPADARVAVALSGGVDSSAVAALAAASGRPITAVAVGTRHGSETDQAETVARGLGLAFEAHELTAADLATMLPGLIDGLACWDAGTLAIQAPLAHVARRLAGRFDLLLTGYGADLLFAGVVDPDLAGRAAECSLADELATALTGPDTAPWPPIAPGPVLRHPYLSAAMVRAALALPMTAKRRGGAVKHCLRHAVDGLLPAEVAWRRKSGVHEGSRMDLLMADALGPGDDASWTGLLEARARAVLGVA